MTSGLLRAERLAAGYGKVDVLRDVDVEVAEGEAVAVVGPNGAGKTTLLRALCGLLAPRFGRVLFRGRDVTGLPVERRARAGITLVPEGRQVFAGLTVEENLRLGAYGRRGDRDVTRDLRRVYERFPALEEHARRPAGSLSGGQQQMLAIGRALLARPSVLLLDEPSLGLAPLAVRETVRALIELRDQGIPLLLVEQNVAAAFAIARRGYILERGAVVAGGPVTRLREDARVAYLGEAGSPDG